MNGMLKLQVHQCFILSTINVLHIVGIQWTMFTSIMNVCVTHTWRKECKTETIQIGNRKEKARGGGRVGHC